MRDYNSVLIILIITVIGNSGFQLFSQILEWKTCVGEIKEICHAQFFGWSSRHRLQSFPICLKIWDPNLFCVLSAPDSCLGCKKNFASRIFRQIGQFRFFDFPYKMKNFGENGESLHLNN